MFVTRCFLTVRRLCTVLDSLDSLNAMNSILTSPLKQKVFERLSTFSLNETNQVVYRAYKSALTLQIISHMGHVLGFVYNIVFSRTRPITTGSKRNLCARTKAD